MIGSVEYREFRHLVRMCSTPAGEVVITDDLTELLILFQIISFKLFQVDILSFRSSGGRSAHSHARSPAIAGSHSRVSLRRLPLSHAGTSLTVIPGAFSAIRTRTTSHWEVFPAILDVLLVISQKFFDLFLGQRHLRCHLVDTHLRLLIHGGQGSWLLIVIPVSWLHLSCSLGRCRKCDHHAGN